MRPAAPLPDSQHTLPYFPFVAAERGANRKTPPVNDLILRDLVFDLFDSGGRKEGTTRSKLSLTLATAPSKLGLSSYPTAGCPPYFSYLYLAGARGFGKAARSDVNCPKLNR